MKIPFYVKIKRARNTVHGRRICTHDCDEPYYVAKCNQYSGVVADGGQGRWRNCACTPGANDFGSIMIEENVVSAAGAQFPFHGGWYSAGHPRCRISAAIAHAAVRLPRTTGQFGESGIGSRRYDCGLIGAIGIFESHDVTYAYSSFSIPPTHTPNTRSLCKSRSPLYKLSRFRNGSADKGLFPLWCRQVRNV
jgi:hypothetical protein